MPVYVDENGQPVAQASPPPTYVDENGKPAAAPPARFSGAGAAASARVANVIKAKGGDPSDWDYVGAAAKGVARAVGIPTNTEELKQAGKDAALEVLTAGVVPAANSAVDMIRKGTDAVQRAREAPSVPRAAQAAMSGVPFVGAPAAVVADPALAYSEGRAPTHAENVSAVEGGATLATLGAGVLIGKASIRSAAANARVENVMRARGVAPEVDVDVSSDPWDGVMAAYRDENGRVYTSVNHDTGAVELRAGSDVTFHSPEDHASITDRHEKGFVAKNGRFVSIEELDAARGDIEAAAQSPAPEPAAMHADNANPLPSIPEALSATKKLAPVKEIVDGINPAGASPQAASAADILRDSKAQISNAATLERYKNADIAKAFENPGPIAERLGKTGLDRAVSDLASDWKSRQAVDERNIAAISTFERTGQFPDAPEGYSEMYKATTDAAHESLQQTYGDDRVGYVDNYVRRAFKFGSDTDEAKASGVLSNYVGSLSASKSPLKGRVLGMPLDDALQTMHDAGIDVKPVTTNPELLRQWTVENANQARVYKQAWADAKSGDLLKFVAQGDRVPQGMVQLNDRVAQVFRPTEEGPVRTGQYFAEPGVARIFNNAISKGLGGSPTFRAVRAMNNAYNQVQLGLSGFHLTGTAINAGISDLSLGLQQIINGDVGAGAKSIGRSAVPAYSFVRDMVNGRNFVNDLLADDPAAKQILNEKLNPAGGRLAIDQSYRNSAYENMVKAWGNRRYVRALGNVPFAVVQKVASPLMEYAIPRVKIGAFLDLAEANRAKLGDTPTDTQVQRAYEQAWDSIDNRFGQIVHDNLFWNRTAADLAQVSTRSVGWNLGTLRELGGGAVDLAKGNVSQRTLYALALPIYAGTIGGIFHYLHTGKRPETARDLYYPQNGLKDSKGRDDRASLPTYMKDVVAYSSDPVGTVEHKASPLLSLAFDLGTNRDYFGDMIRNPEETRSKQLLQMGSYALKQFRPFSVQQAAKTMAEGGVLRAGEQIMGFPSAPAAMKQTAEESEQFKEARRRRNENAMNAAKKKHGG